MTSNAVLPALLVNATSAEQLEEQVHFSGRTSPSRPLLIWALHRALFMWTAELISVHCSWSE